MLIYDNEYETKENKNWTKDKIELQQIFKPFFWPLLTTQSTSFYSHNRIPGMPIRKFRIQPLKEASLGIIQTSQFGPPKMKQAVRQIDIH